MSRRIFIPLLFKVTFAVLWGGVMLILGGAGDVLAAPLHSKKLSCIYRLSPLISEVKDQRLAGITKKIDQSPLRLGQALFGSLLGQAPPSATAGEFSLLSPELADTLAQFVLNEQPRNHFEARNSSDSLLWHRNIPQLYKRIRNYPVAALNDLGGEVVPEEKLWNKVLQNTEREIWPTPLPNDPHEALATVDHERLIRVSQEFRQGLGFLSIPTSGSQSLDFLKSKAQFISQVVLGRFGTTPWNAVGSLVMDALPQAERSQVLNLLSEASIADSGFVATFDPQSGEWGMRDSKTGLIWFGAVRTDLGWKAAKAYCESKAQSLPSQEQWITADRHGILDIFPVMKTSVGSFLRWFWSSTPSSPEYAYVYVSSKRRAELGVSIGFTGDMIFVKCVSRITASKGKTQ